MSIAAPSGRPSSLVSFAITRWLRMPPVEAPRLAYGAPGHTHDPHGVMGLVVDPAVKALAALCGALSRMRGPPQAAGAPNAITPQPSERQVPAAS